MRSSDADRLDQVIRRLYEVFEAYPLRAWTEPCTHCHTEAEEAAVRSKPLAALSSTDLEGFASDALMTWGETVDLKHFLPRLFEIVATEGFGYPDLETILGHLQRGDWTTWPQNEQQAIEDYFHAFLVANLRNESSQYDAETLISAIAQAADDLDPYLARWLEVPGPTPARHIAELLIANGNRLALKGRLANPWLQDRRVQEQQVVAWLGSPAVIQRLEQEFSNTTGGELASVLAMALPVAEGLSTTGN